MLSICIPVYNFDVTQLVKSLLLEMSILSEPVEIILIDDGSTFYKDKNQKLEKDCTYIELTQNIGRSKIRNLFIDHAKFPYLLFIDCDSLIVTPNFIANYISEIKNNTRICCGGRNYPEKCPSQKQRLSWKYGRISESKSAAIRSENPNNSFMTNNFMIEKELFNNIKFDERISQYGHEDTLFGYALEKETIFIKHIDNPILNGAIESNDVFITKTTLAIENLLLIVEILEGDLQFQHKIKLLRTYLKVQKFSYFILIFSKIYTPIVNVLFRRGIINIHLFNVYKLCTLINIKKAVE